MVFVRTCVLGMLGGAVLAEFTVWGPLLIQGDWSWPGIPGLALLIFWMLIVAWLGGLVGVAEAMITLFAVLLLGPLRRWAPVTVLVGGSATAVLPLWLTFRDGWPREHGSPGWIALSCAAFAVGALLIRPVLTGRPYLPAWLAD